MYKVLLADDEPYALVVLRKIIVWEEHGFCIVGTAEDGVSALKMAHDLKPDVVFTDIRMPRMNGLELITELHKLNEKCSLCVSAAIMNLPMCNRDYALGFRTICSNQSSEMI